jgi:maltose O-acetyltransferase
MRLLKWLYFCFWMTMTRFLPDVSPVMRLRGWLVRPAFKSCGRRFMITHNASITFTSKLSIGDDVYLAHGVWIHGMGGVTLEDCVSLGPYAVIVSSHHKQGMGSLRFAENELSPVRLERGVYVGTHAVILHGVTIGENALVTPGSIVHSNVPANALVTGIPGRAVMRPAH